MTLKRLAPGALVLVSGLLAAACAPAPEQPASEAEALTFAHPDGHKHKSSGALVVDFDGERRVSCSGTLISPTVFITAGHCNYYADLYNTPDRWVTFDDVYTSSSKIHHGHSVLHPDLLDADGNFINDLSLVILDHPVNVEPMTLPALHTLDRWAREHKHHLTDQRVVIVGYGVTEPVDEATWVFPDGLGNRSSGKAHFDSFDPKYLYTNHDAANDVGACFGDSGATVLLDSEQLIGVMVGAVSCTGGFSDSIRLDTQEARDFLAPYVCF